MGPQALTRLVQWPVVMLTTHVQRVARFRLLVAVHSFPHIPSWYARRQPYISLYLLCYVEKWSDDCGRNRRFGNVTNFLQTISQMLKCGNSVRTISQILKWWKMSTCDTADFEMLEILYGQYRRC